MAARGLAEAVSATVSLRALANAARVRHDDAAALARAGRFAAAIYVSGDVAEICLEYGCCRAKGMNDNDRLGRDALRELMAHARRQNVMSSDAHPLEGWAAYLRWIRQADTEIDDARRELLRTAVAQARRIWRHWRPELRYLPTEANARQWSEVEAAAGWFVKSLGSL
jgi:hypothetical protein